MTQLIGTVRKMNVIMKPIFLTILFHVVVYCVVYWGETQNRKNVLKNRPPFAAKEALLLQVCHGCADCIDACPYGLLRLVEGKPVLEIDFSACDFCSKCAEACTTGALHRAFFSRHGITSNL